MKSEVTRNQVVYAFATSRSRAKKSVRVCACQIPTAAKSAPSATSVKAKARGTHATSGERATMPKPATKGKTKNASAIPPWRSSWVQRYETPANPTNAASGSPRSRGTSAGTAPRSRRYANASPEAGEHEVEREEQERLLVAELDGDAKRRNCEQRDRCGLREACERSRDEDRGGERGSDERDSRGGGEQELDVVVAHERASDERRRDPEQHEPAEWHQATATEGDEGCSQRSDERSDLGGVGVFHGAKRLRTSPHPPPW